MRGFGEPRCPEHLAQRSVFTLLQRAGHRGILQRGARQGGDRASRWMRLAIVPASAFYIPVALWADVVRRGWHVYDPQDLRFMCVV